ncbi:MAG TPA: GGDEF domain-containing protein [Gaiellaceae bacterium]|jgi:diguanylate cyclase (GGDEF)-like protein|nr:GGDEF domain-containing protein [Gaiellaceae bacterium]
MDAALHNRRLLVALAWSTYAPVFGLFLLFERPGLGIGHFYYVSIALLALLSGPALGALGGLAATAFYVVGILLNPHIPPTDVLTVSTTIRGVTFVSMGMLLGFVARRNRRLLAELRILAERDFVTGLPNTRAFEQAIDRRLAGEQPFSLLLGDMDSLKEINDELGHAEGNDALRRLSDLLERSLSAHDEVARVGGDEFAVISVAPTVEEAAALAERLETVLAAEGCRITFGWASSPRDGTNALSLYRAADERLYARKLLRGYPRGKFGVVGDVGTSAPRVERQSRAAAS